jgi:hypothetical protein
VAFLGLLFSVEYVLDVEKVGVGVDQLLPVSSRSELRVLKRFLSWLQHSITSDDIKFSMAIVLFLECW